MTKALVLVCFTMELGCSSLLGPSTGSQSILSGGRRRTFDVHVPSAASTINPVPLLLVFHGAGGKGQNVEEVSGLDGWADRYGVIVAYPDAATGTRQTWALGCFQCTWADVAGVDDYRFVRDLIDSLSLRLHVDRTRVFVAGVSLGGSFAYDVACHEPGLIAGTAIVASLPSVEELALCRAPTRPIRVVASIGDLDTNVPWNGGTGGSGATYRGAEPTAADWASRNGCTPSPTTRDLPDTNGDGLRVKVLEYVACPGGTFVRYFRVGGVGHAWPRSSEFDFSAELATAFFSPAAAR